MNYFKKQTKRALALFLSLVMCLSLMQVTAFAGEDGTTDDALPAGVSIDGNVLAITGDGTKTFDPTVIEGQDIVDVDTLILEGFTEVNGFENCKEAYAGIRNLEVSNVQTIGQWAFGSNTTPGNLTSITLKNIGEVGYAAFYYQTALEKLELVDVDAIGSYAFGSVGNGTGLTATLQNTDILVDVTNQVHPFYGCKITELTVNGANSVDGLAFWNITTLTKATIENVKKFGGENGYPVFRGCTALNNLTLKGIENSTVPALAMDAPGVKIEVEASIIYNPNGGIGTASTDKTMANVAGGYSFTLSNNTFTPPEGKKFDSWNTEPDGTGTHYQAGDILKGTAVSILSMNTNTLYAQWVEDDTPKVEVNIVYLLNTAVLENPSMSPTGDTPTTSQIVNKDAIAELEVAECASTIPDGIKFVGWNTTSSGSGVSYQPGDSLTVDTSKYTVDQQGEINIILYAQWEGSNCTCGTMCTEGHANGECPACSLSWTFCKSNTVMKEFDLYTHFVPEDNFAEADKAPTLAQIPQDYSLTYQYVFGEETKTVTLNVSDDTKVMCDQDDSEDQGQHHTDPACKWTISVPVANGGDGTIVNFQQDNYDLTGLTYGRTYSAGEIRAETGSPMGKDTSNGSGIFVIKNKNTGTGNDGSRDEIHVYNRYNVTYTVTYTDGVNDQEIFADQTETVISGAATPAFHGTLTREGYTFTGWSPAVSETVSADVTYVAQWKEVSAPTYTLSYNANGGEGAPASQTGESGSTLTVSSTSPTRSGYTFQGWATTADATSATVQPNGSVTMTADVTLYAVWSRNSSGGGGTRLPNNPTPTDPGTTITDPDVPLAPAPGLNSTDHYAYIAGYPDGTVRPQSNITRAEVATIFFRLMTDEFRTTNWASTNNFPDVADASLWYNNAVSTAAKAGLLKGKEDGKFYPSANITRAEFATIAARFTSDEEVTAQPFPDTVGHWAEKDIIRAVQAGWIKGNSDGTFRPNDPITRAEAMTLVNRMLDRVPDKDHMLSDMVTWPDNPVSAWFYEAVQEATNSHDYERDEMGVSETWTGKLPDRDWSALEKEWSNAASSTGKDVAGDLQKD